MATVNTAAKAKTALEIARTRLLAAVPAVVGEPDAQRLSRLANVALSDGVATDYLAAIDAAIG